MLYIWDVYKSEYPIESSLSNVVLVDLPSLMVIDCRDVIDLRLRPNTEINDTSNIDIWVIIVTWLKLTSGPHLLLGEALKISPKSHKELTIGLVYVRMKLLCLSKNIVLNGFMDLCPSLHRWGGKGINLNHIYVGEFEL